VELLGGKIWFTSKPGEGTEFRFTVEAERSWE
jgi:signal transduction histidine kinase